jgi:hypothetical protein
MNEKTLNTPAAPDALVLRGSAVSLESDVGTEFTKHCARNVEGLLCESELRAKYQLNDEDWARLAKNEQLLRAVRTEVDRRISNGECAREAAQRHHARAPTVLNEILRDETVSPRHRIEAAKELRQVAAGAGENTAAGERFVISIDLGEDYRHVKEFEKPARFAGDGGDAQ